LALALRAGAGVVPGLEVADLAEELAVAIEACRPIRPRGSSWLGR
jgi:hypothetical protein